MLPVKEDTDRLIEEEPSVQMIMTVRVSGENVFRTAISGIVSQLLKLPLQM